jgi:hypothetical protein
MKRQLCAIAMLAALASPALLAESATLVAAVPFEFAIGNKAMPAGEYRINFANNGVVTVREANGGPAAMVLGKPTLPAPAEAVPPGTGRLVFERYGNEYFLAGLYRSEVREGLAIPQGTRHKELASRAKPVTATTVAAAK